MSVNQVSSRLDWEDFTWNDPDGGSIILHGVLPTIVFPRKLRPNFEWHGLALLESEDIVELWVQEEKDEAESQGVNRSHALISGGTMALYLDELIELEDIPSGRFPDPEPRRLHRLALRHERPVYCIEPTLDDPAWEEQRTQEAKVSTHWRKLLSMVRIGKKWKKAVKVRIFDAVPPPKNVPKDMATASVLTAAWWDLTESRITPELSSARDERFARRLRGALAVERAKHGDEVNILLPMVQTWRPAILAMLNALPEPEEIISSSGSSHQQEEEE